MSTANPPLDYNAFKSYIQMHIRDCIEEQIPECKITEVCVFPAIKNNDTCYEAMQLFEEEGHSPLIYMDSLYDEYRHGRSLDKIMETVACDYAQVRSQENMAAPEVWKSFSAVKDRLIFRLVNREKNSCFLDHCPYRGVLDLAVSYRVLTSRMESGIATLMVTNTMMDGWGVTEQALYDLAVENTMRLFPACLKTMRELADEGLEQACEARGDTLDMEKVFDLELFVATNSCGVNGASVICYPGFLASVGKTLNSDFFVLPSSIHEVILLPAWEGVTGKALSKIVSGANAGIVAKDEFLSDSVYYYCIQNDEIKKCSGQTGENLLQ